MYKESIFTLHWGRLLLPAPEVKLVSRTRKQATLVRLYTAERERCERLPLATKTSAIFISVGNCLVCRRHQLERGHVFVMRGMGVTGVCVCVCEGPSASSSFKQKASGRIGLWFVVLLYFSSQVKTNPKEKKKPRVQQRSEAVGFFRVKVCVCVEEQQHISNSVPRGYFALFCMYVWVFHRHRPVIENTADSPRAHTPTRVKNIIIYKTDFGLSWVLKANSWDGG